MGAGARALQSLTLVGAAVIFTSCALISCDQARQGATTSGDHGVRVDVAKVGFDPASGDHFVELDDQRGGSSLEIAVGEDEARAIAFELQGVKVERPMTSDLLRNVIAQTGHTVERVEITERRGEIYYAKIFLDHGRYTIDSRPSDAIALALGMKAPIYVSSRVMEAAPAEVTRTAEALGIKVQDLTPDMADYFGVDVDSGVVVADLGAGDDRAGLRRGDIITQVEGQPVRTTGDFVRVAGAAPRGRIGLTIRRGGHTQSISVPATTAAGAPQ